MIVQNLDKYKLLPGMRTIKGQLKLLLRHHRMPGDILTMTPLIRDIKMTYGSQVLICCDTPQGQEIWENNPYVRNPYHLRSNMLLKGDFVPDETYNLDNKMAAENEARGLNMAEAFRQDFMRQSGLHLIAATMWPDIYLTEDEISNFDKSNFHYGLRNRKFWVVCPGNKSSCQVKIWPRSRWSEFFNQNRDYTFIQIGQSKHGHKPFDLGNVINFIDKTTLRELFVLIYLSQGTIGYCSLHMHVAAAFKKPSLVLAGGRESPSLFKYPNHFIVSDLGALPCCRYTGCYQGKGKTVRECCGEQIFTEGEIDFPECMGFDDDFVTKIFRYMAESNERLKPAIEPKAKFEGERFHGEKYVEEMHKMKEERVKEKFKVTLKGNRIEADKELSEEEKKILCVGDGYVKEKDHEFKQKKPLFRMICNATCYGGGERTAIRIMHLMAAKGYDIEFVPATGNVCQDTELLRNMPAECSIQDVYSKDKIIADIVFFQANDTLYRYRMAKNDDWVAPWFKAAKRSIIGVNYTTWGLENSAYAANVYICQSRKLRLEFIPRVERIILPNRRSDFLKDIHLLKPPADLSRFFEHDYSKRKIYDAHINLVRHSSQGDQKYPNNINEQLEKISEIDSSIIVRFMPAPTFLKRQNYLGVASYSFNERPVEQFLNYGNVFWYWVPKDKFIEAGCNAVLEAMAAGLPILCNDNGGLVDIIDDEVGWMCTTEQEMYDAIKNMTMDEIKKKGQAAREKVKKLIDPESWTKVIIGE